MSANATISPLFLHSTIQVEEECDANVIEDSARFKTKPNGCRAIEKQARAHGLRVLFLLSAPSTATPVVHCDRSDNCFCHDQKPPMVASWR
jgi:hypothetical protein